MSMLLKNCKILRNGRLSAANILIEKGKIKKITKKNLSASNVLDLDGKIVIPGVIDCHVHFREPGLTHKEDLLTGSRAAAKGGITTFFDMPNTIPPTFTVKNLEQKRKLARKSVVNYGFHFGASLNNLNEIRKSRNVPSVKIYMDDTTGHLKVDRDKVIQDIMKLKPVISVHAEGKSVLKAIHFIKKTSNKLYLCHVSSKKEMDIIKKEKTKRIFVEVTPHHLFLTNGSKAKFAVMKPSLKFKKDQEALWVGISSGLVDTICTDHAPHTIAEKKKGSWGVPGEETMLPLLLDAVNAKKLTLQKMVELTAHNPARIFNIKNKGYIKEGYDADLTVIDLKLRKKVQKKDLLTKCKWSPWEGKTLKGWPVMTIVNGNVVYDGKIHNFKGKEVTYG